MILETDTHSADGDFAITEGPITVRKLTGALPAASHYPAQTMVVDQYGQMWMTDGTRWNLAGAPQNHIYLHPSVMGTDFGPAVNAADAYLGSNTGTIHIPDGNYSCSTSIVLSSNRTLIFGAGTYTFHTSELGISFGSVYAGSGNPTHNSNITVKGQGWSTVLVESDSPNDAFGGQWGFTVIGVDGRNDTGAVTYGTYRISDLKIIGHSGNPHSGTYSTISLGNALFSRVERVWLESTNALGIQIGGPDVGHAVDCWITDCYFHGVAQQPLSPVNFKGLKVRGCLFEAGSNTQTGTFLDAETNTASGWAEDFEIVDNTFDARGITAVGNAVFGLQVIGQNPTLDSQRVGPGTISDNVFIGIQYTPEAVTYNGQMSRPIGLFYARDVVIANNIIRYSAETLVQSCTRIKYDGNMAIDQSGASVNILDSTFVDVTDNTFVWKHFINPSPMVQEIGGSNFNFVHGNRFSAGDGDGSTGQVYQPQITTVGTATRVGINFFGGFWNGYAGDFFGQFRLGAVGFDLRNFGVGQMLAYYGNTMVPVGPLSDSQVSAIMSAFPFSTTAVIGSAMSLGMDFHVTRPVTMTAIRIYRDASDTTTTRQIRLFSFPLGGVHNIGGAQIHTYNTVAESGTGWVTLAITPIQLDPHINYSIAVDVPAATIWKNTGRAYPLTRGPIVIDAMNSFSGLGTWGPAIVTTDQYPVDVVCSDNIPHTNTSFEKLLSTTSATDIVSLATPDAGVYSVGCSYRVVGDTSDVTITLTWKDPDGNSRSETLESAIAQAVGQYEILCPGGIAVDSSGALKITATAGTAGRVAVTASVERK